MTIDPRYLKAKREVEARQGFYIHAFIFLCVMSLLLVINVLTSAGAWWIHWPLLGWGAGLLIHGLAVYRPISLFGDDWKERKIRERMQNNRADAPALDATRPAP